MMDGLLAGRRILVTGAARGIGLAVAQAARAFGAKVALADVDHEACIDAAARFEAPESEVMAVAMDVTDRGSVAETLERVKETFGGLDGLVNNAARVDQSNAASVGIERFEEVMATNLTSLLQVSQAALPHLEESSHAAIVNSLSTQSFFGQANSVAYSSAKAGALSLTRNMAIDLAPRGIRVNGVAPGFIDTRMAIMASGEHEHGTELFQRFYITGRRIPMGRAGTPDDCAGAFIFLLSDLSRYVTGQVVTVDGGLTATY